MSKQKTFHSNKQWVFPDVEEGTYLYLSDRFGISPVISRILVQRGFRDEAEVEKFLYPRFSDLHNPYSMSGMETCVARIRRAILNEEKILIYGDRDVDGVTGTVLLKECLEDLGGIVAYYLPTEEGYGLDPGIIGKIHQQGISLVITVDCGISNAAEIGLGISLGMDFIVTDHHDPHDLVPTGIPVLNPKLPDSGYRFRDLAGVGVVFKLAQALYMESPIETWDQPGPMEKYMDLVTLGTVADLVPLLGENRILVKEGLKFLTKTKRTGLQVLYEKAFNPRPYNLCTRDIGWEIAPVLNSPGRFGDPYITFHLLSTCNEQKGLELVDDLFAINKFRIQSTKELYNDMVELIEQNPSIIRDPILVLRADGHELGVTGLVANRLKDRYSRPVILFSDKNDTLLGSGRAMGNIDLLNIVTKASSYMEKFGGHQHAMGMTVKKDKFEGFKLEIIKLASEYIKEEDLKLVIHLDSKIKLKEIDRTLLDELMLIEPLGMCNREPIFAIYNCHPSSVSLMGTNGDHIRMKFRAEDKEIPGIGWGLGYMYEDCCYPESRLDIACTLENKVNSRDVCPMLKLVDIKPRLKNEFGKIY